MSGDFNIVILSGRLARDPETKYLSDGRALTTIDLALTTRVKRGDRWEDGTVFINRLTAWDKQAEIIRDYVRQGDQIMIEGRLRVNEWTTQEGNKRRNLEVTITNFRFGAKKVGGQSRSRQEPAQQPPPPSRDDERSPDNDYDSYPESTGEDIPF